MPPLPVIALIVLSGLTIAVVAKIDHVRVEAANNRAAELQEQVNALTGEVYAGKRNTAQAMAQLAAYQHQVGENTVQLGLQAALADVCQAAASHQ